MSTLNFPSNILPESMTFQLLASSQVFKSPVSSYAQVNELVGAALWKSRLTFPILEARQGRIMLAFLTNLRGQAGNFYLPNFSHLTPDGVATGTPLVNGANAAVDNVAGYAAGTTNITVDSMSARTFEVGEYVQFENHDSIYQLQSGTTSTLLVLPTGGLDEAVIDNEVVDIYHIGTTLKTDGWTATQTGILLAGDHFSVNGELKIMTEDVDSDGSGNATLVFQPPLRNTITDNTSIVTSSPKAIMRLVDDEQAIAALSGPSIADFSFECVEDF